MARLIRASSLVVCALFCIASISSSQNLQHTPDYYWDNQNFGSSFSVLRISPDVWNDIIVGYSAGGARYIFNDTPNGNWGRFNMQTGSSIAFGANQIKAGIIYAIWDHWDVAMVADGIINIYRNDLDGDLNLQQTIDIPENGTANWIDLGNINGDMYPDMVASSGGSQIGDQYLYNYSDYNDPIPNTPPQTIFCGPGIPQQVQLALLESEGSGESLVAATGHLLKTYENTGQIGEEFEFRGMLSVDANLNQVVDFDIADLDADLDLDIVACSAYYIQVFVNQASGLSFISGQGFALEGIEQIALGEFNYDGFPDLAVATNTNITIYINEGGPFNITQYPPAWQYAELGNDFGGSCDMNELQFSDLIRSGALSLLFTARGDGTGALGVFKDVSNPSMCPVKNFSVLDGTPGEHPHLLWMRNEELDAHHYDIYRALMPDEIPPTPEDFELLTVVNHPDTSYIDTTVTIHTQYDNYKIWYAAKAVDTADNESLWSNFIRFWGYYENSGGSVDVLVASLDSQELDLQAAPNPSNNEMRLTYALRQTSPVQLQLLDTGGRIITKLHEGWLAAGVYSIAMSTHDLPSGIYYARLLAGGNVAIQKLVILK